MRNLFLIIGFLSLFAFEAKCDTIDYWHVYYNGKLIENYNQNGEFVIKQSEVLKGGEIEIKYYRDAPCDSCMEIYTMVDLTLNRKTTIPIEFGQQMIIKLNSFYFDDHITLYEFYENRGEPYPTEPHLIFKLRVE